MIKEQSLQKAGVNEAVLCLQTIDHGKGQDRSENNY